MERTNPKSLEGEPIVNVPERQSHEEQTHANVAQRRDDSDNQHNQQHGLKATVTKILDSVIPSRKSRDNENDSNRREENDQSALSQSHFGQRDEHEDQDNNSNKEFTDITTTGTGTVEDRGVASSLSNTATGSKGTATATVSETPGTEDHKQKTFTTTEHIAKNPFTSSSS